MSQTGKSSPLLAVSNLQKHFPISRGMFRQQAGVVRALDGITFDLYQGETVGLVGESGCGKSTLGRVILQLTPATAGQVLFKGQEVTAMKTAELRQTRRHIQMIFPNPYSALNPRLTVGEIIDEPLEIQGLGNRQTRQERGRELLTLVGLNPYFSHRRPYEFSGGQRQKIAIARALATTPDLIIADEPVAALDVAIQEPLVDLLVALKARLGLTYLFLTADLSLAHHVSNRIAVMYEGQLVEFSDKDTLYEHPFHPYTQALRAATPARKPAGKQKVMVAGGVLNPSVAIPLSGCRFQTRCPYASAVCAAIVPEWRNLGDAKQPHWVACHHAVKE